MKKILNKLSPLASLVILSWLFIFNCSGKESEVKTLFHKLPVESTNVHFENTLSFDPEFNVHLYRNFYNGGGVAIGDVSGNGLPDIYLTGNMVENRLFFNQGDFRFEDVTESAGVAGSREWSTGASMVDINGNGLLDIYVTNSGELDDRRNELFINNGDGTFTESAKEYGLDDLGYSIHATFFDYNGDGLLDLYLINNSNESISSFVLENNLRNERDSLGGDRLYRNEGGYFTDITEEAGLYSPVIGFALSATVSDINRNGLTDLYVANDFFERDYLYINQGDGTFEEVIKDDVMRSISSASMGSDIADVNNNGWTDIYVSDMLPDDEVRLKQISTFEDLDTYRNRVEWGYGHQFQRNVLHLNQGGEFFKEVGRKSTIQATDWSWAVLMADFDHNGFNDIFVANGLVDDLTNLDHLEEILSDTETARRIITGEDVDFKRLIEETPSNPTPNFVFGNDGDLKFTNRTKEWGLDTPGFSSSAAWADLNGNGSLDLVVNNVNGPVWIYQNYASDFFPDRKWLWVELEGNEPNTQGIGAQLQVWAGDKYWFREHFLQRGFQSSVQPGLHVGLGETPQIDSLVVRWPDGHTSRLTDFEVPAKVTLSQAEAIDKPAPKPSKPYVSGDLTDGVMSTNLEKIRVDGLSDWFHKRYEYSDFNRESLLMRMRSTEGPALCIGDINGNNLDDIYTGGARGQAGVLWVQNSNGEFLPHQQEFYENDAGSEDIDCQFFDATGNGADDLYVVSGGNSFSTGSSSLNDRFYQNDGQGNFSKTSQVLPTARGYEPGSVVQSYDFTGDNNQDLFVGTRLGLFAVGLPVNGYLLAGDGQGNFRDVTEQWAPDLLESGMITDGLWADLTGDGNKELIVVGEWMSIRVFTNTGEYFKEITDELGLTHTRGWWNALAAGDLNGNGRTDLIVANHGLNSKFRATAEQPVKMWVGDFARNGRFEHILAIPNEGNYYPVALRHDLLEEIPSLRQKYPDYASFAGQTIDQIFTSEQLDNSLELTADLLASVVIWNTEEGLKMEELPVRAQLSPMYGIHLEDINGNGLPEVIIGGNLYDVKPESGPYDASRGVVLTMKDDKLKSYTPQFGGLNITGEIRNIRTIRTENGSKKLIAIRYNQSPVVWDVK